MLLLLEHLDLILKFLIYLFVGQYRTLLVGLDGAIAVNAVAEVVVPGTYHALGEHELAGRVLALVVGGLLVVGQVVQEVELLLSGVKRLPLALPLLEDLRDDLARNGLFLLDLLQID